MSSRPSIRPVLPETWFRGGGRTVAATPAGSPFGELLPIGDRLAPRRRGAGLALFGGLHLGFENVLPQLLVLGSEVDRPDVLRAATEDLAGRRVVEVRVGRAAELRVVQRLDVRRHGADRLVLGQLAVLAGQVLDELERLLLVRALFRDGQVRAAPVAALTGDRGDVPPA